MAEPWRVISCDHGILKKILFMLAPAIVSLVLRGSHLMTTQILLVCGDDFEHIYLLRARDMMEATLSDTRGTVRR
jgi:hypothetical protein